MKSIFSIGNQRVSLTTDIWTSIQNINYMVITGHFIDSDWQLHRRILSFCPINNHKGDSIGRLIESCLQHWGIERIFTVTVDNASANAVAITQLVRKMRTWRGDALVLNGEYVHMRCCAHILNLVVSDGLKELDDSIIAIRNAVKYVRSSPSRLEAFKSAVARERIESKGSVILDVPTRWNSTYLMLNAALDFQKAFDRMIDDDGHYAPYFRDDENGSKRIGPPTDMDWEKAQYFADFLEIFYDATNMFSASSTVTSCFTYNEICKVYTSLKNLARNEDPLLHEMAIAMKMKFDKYWETTAKINKLLIVGTILDPRRKMTFANVCFGILFDNDNVKIEEIRKSTRDLLKKLYDMYNDWYGKNGLYVDGDRSGAGGVTSVGGYGSSAGMTQSQPFVRPRAQDRVRKRSTSVLPDDPFQVFQKGHVMHQEESTEVDMYLMEPYETSRDPSFSVLMWWKTNTGKYPILARIARDIFAMPVSTVASESAFSTGGRVLDNFRSSLTPVMVEALICTQNWIRNNLTIDKTNEVEAMILEAEYYEKLEEGKKTYYLVF